MVETLLEVRQLSKTFRYRTGWFHRQTVEAVKPLSFTLRERQTLAIIGENGSGKSTLAKMLAGMVEPTSGELLIDDHPLTFGDYSYRSQKIRMIFQDPSTSLNPRQRISQILDFPLRLNTDLDAEARQKQIIDTLRMVGLLPDHVSYYPHMLAPGQKQRLGLARALILRPKVIICDEALASLDMSMRSQLINLMLELQEKQGISYIYVTQHLGMMKHISDQVLVMHNGEVVERGSTGRCAGLAAARPDPAPDRRPLRGSPHRRRLAQRREIAGRQRQGRPSRRPCHSGGREKTLRRQRPAVKAAQRVVKNPGAKPAYYP
ncbi:Peptide transport system ATP-binding protein SapF [Klebsiella pneumoniae IS53]|nr:Peptide transport system ATP-binding protein SapF [Klebsiella pneumoniae IS53]